MQEFKFTPQVSDSDILGHINYLAMARWFEEARSPLYRYLFPNYVGIEKFLVLVHMDFDYVDETLLDQEVTIRTTVSKIGGSSFNVSQEAWQGVRLCVKASFVLVHFDLAARKKLPIDDQLRRKIQQWSGEEPE